MLQKQDITVNKSALQFNADVINTGSYSYTKARLSTRIVNSRFSKCIANSIDFTDKMVLDLGCGDGTYTLEFPSLGVKNVVGLDPAAMAIEVAKEKARKLGVDNKVKFEVGDIYAPKYYLGTQSFDCIVLRGVLHHLPNPELAISGLASFNGTIIILEPNGNNPVLKLIEKFSRYHIAHAERSFSPVLICSWFTKAGFKIFSSKVFNLVPMFCPNYMAKALNYFGPIVERLPMISNILCGQCIIVAHK